MANDDGNPIGGHSAALQGLSPADLSAAIDSAFEGIDDGEPGDRQQAKHMLFDIAVHLLGQGAPLPDQLRLWLATRLRSLCNAMEVGTDAVIRNELQELGRAPQGRPKKGQHADEDVDPKELEILAGAAALKATIGKANAAQSLATAYGVSVASIYRMCEFDEIPSGDLSFRPLVDRALARLRLSARREPHKHPQKTLDFLRVTGE